MRNDDRDQFSRTELDGKNAKKKISTSSKMVIFLMCVFVVTHFFQFIWLAMESKGEYQKDRAWKELASAVLNRQYSGEPQIRVAFAKQTHHLCDRWSFEALWGECMIVRFSLFVRDYHPEHRFVVEKVVQDLANELRNPCDVILSLKMKDGSVVWNNIGCADRGAFKFDIWVNEVSVHGERIANNEPARWALTSAKHLYLTETFIGEM